VCRINSLDDNEIRCTFATSFPRYCVARFQLISCQAILVDIYIHLDNWESNSRLMEDRGWRLTESGVQQWDGKGSAIALRVNC